MAKHQYEGILVGKGLKFAVVVSRFNELITTKLLDGAKDALLRHGVADSDIDVAWTPGCLEIPLVSKKLAQSNKYDAIVCLGAVIRGGTSHAEYVASEVNQRNQQGEPGYWLAGDTGHNNRRYFGAGYTESRSQRG